MLESTNGEMDCGQGRAGGPDTVADSVGESYSFHPRTVCLSATLLNPIPR